MNDTTQLKTLRDAARTSNLAIASLEAAEQPKPCAGFVCSYPPCPKGELHSDNAPCRKCGQPYSAHQQPSAEQAQQPAPADVPPMPQVVAFEETVDGPDFGCAEDAVRALHAACVRIAQECDALNAECAHWDEVQRETQDKLDEARRELEAVKEDKRCALDLLAQERAGRPGSINAMTITSLRERLAEAEAELAALKGQEPVAWRYKHRLGYTFSGTHPGYGTHEGRSSQALYAAPIPPPDSVPREQHEAALAQARRQGLREALALVERDRVSASLKSQDSRDAAWNALAMAADGIRALAEKGGKVGK